MTMNFDRPGAPQVVTISFQRLQVPDDHANAQGADSHDDGFWPSRDPEAAGYVDPDKFEEEQAKAQARFDGFGDSWHFVGHLVRAHISVPIGGGSFTQFSLESAGLWGTESDCGDEYSAELWEEQESDLKAQLRAMGLAFLTLDGAASPVDLLRELRGEVQDWADALNGEREGLDALLARVDSALEPEKPRPVYTLAKGDAAPVTFSTWREALAAVYLAAAEMADDHGFTSDERGGLFADLPGGNEPPQPVMLEIDGDALTLTLPQPEA